MVVVVGVSQNFNILILTTHTQTAEETITHPYTAIYICPTTMHSFTAPSSPIFLIARSQNVLTYPPLIHNKTAYIRMYIFHNQFFSDFLCVLGKIYSFAPGLCTYYPCLCISTSVAWRWVPFLSRLWVFCRYRTYSRLSGQNANIVHQSWLISVAFCNIRINSQKLR